MEESRKAFQQWFEADAFPAESDWFKLDEDGEYDHAHTWIAWKAWQAAKHWPNPPESIPRAELTGEQLRAAYGA